LEDQMASNVLPWQSICAEMSAPLIAARRHPNGWAHSVTSCLVPGECRVAIVAVPRHHWADGSVIDLEAIAQACEACGARLVVDATQTLGAAPLSVRSLGPSLAMLCASVHKWLCGLYGTCLAYYAPDISKGASPLEHFERNREGNEDPKWDNEGAFDVAAPGYPTDWCPGAQRFDGGGRPNPVLLPTLVASLKQVIAWGPDQVAQYTAVLLSRLVPAVTSLGFLAPKEHAPHIVGFTLREGGIVGVKDLADVVKQLKQRGVIVSVRAGVLRVSAHVYNTEQHIDRFVTELRGVLGDGAK